jgi:hypothetical protein
MLGKAEAGPLVFVNAKTVCIKYYPLSEIQESAVPPD